MSCKVPSPDIVDLGTRIAIYSYAGCSALLGFLTLVGSSQRHEIQNTEDEDKYTELVLNHVRDVNYAVETSTLTGAALIAAALWHQHKYHTLTLFHACIVLLLLWVITLTGMWFVIHAWVFDIFRKNKRRMSTFSFWQRILRHSLWFTIQFSFLGGYGFYVTLRRDDFLSPECVLRFFGDKTWWAFVYGFAMVPILNSCFLFMSTSLLVWICSVVVVCVGKGWEGQVDPAVFCTFWLLEYVLMIGGLVATIETQLKKHTLDDDTGSPSPFGSTLALTLVIVPGKLVLVRIFQMMTHHSRDGVVRPRLDERLPSESRHLMSSSVHSRESSAQTMTSSYHQRESTAGSYRDRPPSYH